MSDKKMTETLENALALLPRDKWFEVDDVPYPQVKRVRYVLGRLEQLGKLEGQLFTEKGFHTYKWRVLDINKQ